MSSDAPVFVVGCDRSGTTLLRLLLTYNPGLHMLGETNFIDRLWLRREDYGDFAHPRQRWFFIRDLMTNQATSRNTTFLRFCLSCEETEAAIAEAAPTNYAGACDAVFRASARKAGKNRWGDKSPAQVNCTGLLCELFPGAKIIHIVRDARACVSSMRNAGWRNGNIEELAKYYVDRVTAGLKAGASLGKEAYREVRYETLVELPEATLRWLCAWIELEYSPEMLEFYKYADEHHPTRHDDPRGLARLVDQPIGTYRVDAWKQELSDTEVAQIESVAGQVLRKLGYGLVHRH